jgi:hypothetical protein
MLQDDDDDDDSVKTGSGVESVISKQQNTEIGLSH